MGSPVCPHLQGVEPGELVPLCGFVRDLVGPASGPIHSADSCKAGYKQQRQFDHALLRPNLAKVPQKPLFVCRAREAMSRRQYSSVIKHISICPHLHVTLCLPQMAISNEQHQRFQGHWQVPQASHLSTSETFIIINPVQICWPSMRTTPKLLIKFLN